jgi:hypothetical protein
VIKDQFNTATQNLEHRFGTQNNMGSPAYRAMMREMERDRALAHGQLESWWQQQAAALHEPIRQQRIGQLGSNIDTEFNRTMKEMVFQHGLNQDANNQYNDLFKSFLQSYYMPMQYSDEGLRLMLGGIGSALNANSGMAGAASGMAGMANTGFGAAQNSNQGVADLISMFFAQD